jgi:hypothetical protein
MPALVPACWLMAMTLSAEEVRFRGKIIEAKTRLRLALRTAIAAGLLLCLYAVAVVPALQRRRSKVKPIAARIDSRVPGSEPLYAFDPDYQPFLFYVRSHVIYVSRLDDIPGSARYLLIQPEREREVMESERWSPRHAQPIERIPDYRNHKIILARIGDG